MPDAAPTRDELLLDLEAARAELTLERAARSDLQRSLLESEERNRSLYNQAPVMLHSIDRGGRLLSVSDHWLRVLGYEREEVVGRRSTEFLTPESQRYARDTILPAYFETGVCNDVPYQLVTKAGEVRDVLLSAIAERDEQGEHARSFAVIIDITERKRIEDDFHRAQKLESLGVLASGIAHDFNNLLVGIYGFTDLALLELSPRSTVHDYLLEAKKAAGHAADLIRQLLAYAGKGQVQRTPVDLNALIRGMSDLLRTTTNGKTSLRLELGEQLVPVQGDASQIRQVVLNLITNAAQAIGDDVGEIVVRTDRTRCTRAQLDELDGRSLPEGDYVSLEIRDTGPGLAPGTLARIFDPFFTTKTGGSGLGLAAVHGIVRSHKGGLRVESDLGQGTQFRIYLPASRAKADVAPAAVGMGDWRGSGTVLLVDDEPSVCQVGQGLLEQLGFQVARAMDGVEAVRIFRERSDEIACVVLDYQMPHMDGAETFRALAAIRPEVPVVLSSGYTDRETAEDLVAQGLAGFVQKPYGLIELRRVLRAALNS